MNIKFLKKWGGYLSFLSLAILVLVSCGKKTTDTAAGLESTINKTSSKFSINHLSYLVCEEGNIVTEKSDAESLDAMNELNKLAFLTLYAPLELDRYFKESIINSGDTLNKTFGKIRNSNIKYCDLLLVPADHFEPNSFHQDSVIMMINKIITSGKQRKKKAIDVSRDFQLEFGATDEEDKKGNYFKKISALSDHLLKSHPEFRKAQDTVIADLFPTWYAENKSLIFGWKILRLKSQVIFWNFFRKGDSDVLLLKFMDKNIFVSLSYNSKNITSPYSYNREDLLQSPLAVALIKDVLFKNDSNNNRSYGQIKDIKNDDLRLLKLKELIAEARYYQKAGNRERADVLFQDLLSITGEPLYTRYINEKAVADIGYVSNNLNTSAEFTVENDGYYRIFSGGQVAGMNDFNTSPYQYDNIQLYLNDKVDQKDMTRDKTKLFHFNYRLDRVAGMPDDRHQGNWLKDSKIKFAFDDPTDSTYTLEVAIPWDEIRSDGQAKPVKLGMNILIGDSDYTENQRESILSWATKAGQDWSDPFTYGHLLLKNQRSVEKNYTSSGRIKTTINIDGKPDQAWSGVKDIRILNAYSGTFSTSDNSAAFKSLWDERNLYFLFSVTDNCKNKTGVISKDKCWIEDKTGELIWKLPAEIDSYFPSYSIAQKIYLKAGKYSLRYRSDNKHSNEAWIGKSPKNFVYGGLIYKEINK